jgi:ElaB/YqjD/DUF883 family membrane-anchored ribosome-binding protein
MPETLVRNWQITGLRVLRAQERMLDGMMSATRLEMQFGQDLIMNRMARDRMITMIREVTDELSSGFKEATQLLTETADEVIQDTAKAVKATTDRAAEATQEGLQSSGRFTKKEAESAKETRDTAKEERRRSG